MARAGNRSGAAKASNAHLTQLVSTILIVMVIAAIPSLTGGYGRREIEDTAFVLALGFDRNPDGLYQVTSQVAIPAKAKDGGGAGALPVIVVTSTGRSVAEAVMKFSHSSNKEPFWGQVRVAVFGEELAREGILPVIDFLTRSHDPRVTMWTLVTEGRAEDVMTAETETENLPAMFLSGLEEETKFHSTAPRTTLFQTSQTVGSLTEDALLAKVVRVDPGKEVKAGESGDTVPKKVSGGAANPLSLDGSAVFQDDKLVGWLSPTETRGALWLRGDMKGTIINFDDPAAGVTGAVRVFVYRRLLKVNVDPNDLRNCRFTITIRTDANLTEYLGGGDVMEPEIRAAIEAAVARHIHDEATGALTRLQSELKADVIGFGELARERLANATWNEVGPGWFEAYPDVDVDIKVDFKLRRPGMFLGRVEPARSGTR